MSEARKLAPPRLDKKVNNIWPSSGMLEDAILQLMADGDGAYFTSEIAHRLRAPYSAVRNTLHRLKRAGKVKQKTAGTSNNQSIWWLVQV